jgi:hypothetical protein
VDGWTGGRVSSGVQRRRRKGSGIAEEAVIAVVAVRAIAAERIDLPSLSVALAVTVVTLRPSPVRNGPPSNVLFVPQGTVQPT